MKLHEIYAPINEDLKAVRAEIDSIAAGLEGSPSKAVFEQYFRVPGKLLRPSLLLLSAAAADRDGYGTARPKLVKAAAAVELVHNASLMHDDIVDSEVQRRGSRTVNIVFGDKIAVMAGNALFARAVSILLEDIGRESAMQMVQVVKRMSSAEISRKHRNGSPESRAEYEVAIEGKTALLMSFSCMLGASAVTADRGRIASLEQFGLNFGMAYQTVDDYIDQDPFTAGDTGLEDANRHAGLARASLGSFDGSPGKKALFEMLEYILSLTHVEAETSVKSVVNYAESEV